MVGGNLPKSSQLNELIQPLCQRNTPITPDEAVIILQEEEDKAVYSMPFRPKAGEVYLYKTKGMDSGDWESDGYLWSKAGAGKPIPHYKNIKLFTFNILVKDFTQGLKKISDNRFKKIVYAQDKKKRGGSLALIHYVAEKQAGQKGSTMANFSGQKGSIMSTFSGQKGSIMSNFSGQKGSIIANFSGLKRSTIANLLGQKGSSSSIVNFGAQKKSSTTLIPPSRRSSVGSHIKNVPSEYDLTAEEQDGTVSKRCSKNELNEDQRKRRSSLENKNGIPAQQEKEPENNEDCTPPSQYNANDPAFLDKIVSCPEEFKKDTNGTTLKVLVFSAIFLFIVLIAMLTIL